MRRFVAVLLVCVSIAAVRVPGPAVAAAPVVHHVHVQGAGVAMFPAFADSTERYAVTTTGDTGGTVTVTATTSDPAGKVYVDGRRATGGTVELTGLAAGDEIAVFIDDSSGRSVHSLVYLPAGFPTLTRTTPDPAAGALAPGLVMLTLGTTTARSPTYETAVDANGVPAMVRAVPHALDLKRQPNGHYSVSRTTETPGRTGSALVELDSTFAEIRRYETVGLTDTDGHDSILAPDGSRILLAYEPDQQTGLVDAVIQKVDADGQVVFEWNSRDHMDPAAETVATGADYAHVNSVWVMHDGDLLVSFRHLSSVYRIAMTPHDGHAVGDVVWKLGGRHSDFTFVDDPDGGPCAQHSATQLPDGHILLFDNGSWNLSGSMCVDPADPTGPTTMRTVSRITEYALDETTGEARLVWKYEVPDRFAIFAGSARRLANGNTLVGWAAATEAVTSEVSPAGDLLWELTDPGSTPHLTYRALKFDVPDTQSPLGAIRVPVAGATYRQRAQVRVDFRCTDRGGSSLHGCAATTAAGALLDTSTPGKHVFRLTAVDGAGNTTVRRRVYTVSPASRPDALIRSTRSSSFVGDDVYGMTDGQQVWQRLGRAGTARSFVIRLQNDGVRRDRFAVLGGAGSNRFRVTYRAGSGPVTAQLTNGTFLTPVLAPGAWSTVRLTVTRTRAAERGDTRRIRITATSTRSDRRDSVVAVVWAAPRRP